MEEFCTSSVRAVRRALDRRPLLVAVEEHRTVCIWGQGEEWDTVYRGKEEHLQDRRRIDDVEDARLQLRKTGTTADRPTSFSTALQKANGGLR